MKASKIELLNTYYESAAEVGKDRLYVEYLEDGVEKIGYFYYKDSSDKEREISDEEIISGLEEAETEKEEEEMKIYTADRETGTFIEECASIDEALAKIEEYEEADKKEGTYEEGFYDVVNEDHETLV